MGLKKYGKGDWRNISRNFVTTRTPTQVASHAQKYFIRQLTGGKDKRRSSIHDITTVHLPDNDNHNPLHQTSPRPFCGMSSLGPKLLPDQICGCQNVGPYNTNVLQVQREQHQLWAYGYSLAVDWLIFMHIHIWSYIYLINI